MAPESARLLYPTNLLRSVSTDKQKGENVSTITRTPQDLQLEMMRLASFNEFDGPYVADSLEANRDLWRGAIFDRAAYFNMPYPPDQPSTSDPIDDIRLRDIGSGYWNADTLYLLPVEGKEDKLELLAHKWGADEIDWQTGKNAGRFLRVWWD